MTSDDQARETGSDPGSLSRRSFLALSAAAAATVVLPGIDTPAEAAQGNCQPFLTPPDYLGIVPTTTQVLGFEAGRREVTTAQCYQYLDAVAAASDRVRVGVVGHSSVGREIRYAIIGRPEHVTNAGLEKVRQAHYEIADPSTTQARVNHLAETTPAFLWVCGNIHGDEESGADAIVSLVYGLADRDDCVVNRLLKNAVVVVIPIQNPDGRALDTRSNYYAFDLNRDHFGRTQPETDGKIQLMRKYPPLVLTDHHEFGYYRSFFPPTDDPVYHEVTNRQIHDIYNVYGPVMAKEFQRRGWHYFNQGYGYDFFSPIFTDTLTSFGFQGAGMTVEVYDGARSTSGGTAITPSCGSRSRRPPRAAARCIWIGTRRRWRRCSRGAKVTCCRTVSTSRRTTCASRCRIRRYVTTSSAPTGRSRSPSRSGSSGSSSAWTSRCTG